MADPRPRMRGASAKDVRRHAAGPSGRRVCRSVDSRLWPSDTSRTSIAPTPAARRITVAGASSPRPRNPAVRTAVRAGAAKPWHPRPSPPRRRAGAPRAGGTRPSPRSAGGSSAAPTSAAAAPAVTARGGARRGRAAAGVRGTSGAAAASPRAVAPTWRVGSMAGSPVGPRRPAPRRRARAREPPDRLVLAGGRRGRVGVLHRGRQRRTAGEARQASGRAKGARQLRAESRGGGRDAGSRGLGGRGTAGAAGRCVGSRGREPRLEHRRRKNSRWYVLGKFFTRSSGRRRRRNRRRQRRGRHPADAAAGAAGCGPARSRHKTSNGYLIAVFPILADVVEVKTGSRSTAHWSNDFIRLNGWLRNCFAQLITPLDIDGIGQNWEDSNMSAQDVIWPSVQSNLTQQAVPFGLIYVNTLRISMLRFEGARGRRNRRGARAASTPGWRAGKGSNAGHGGLRAHLAGTTRVLLCATKSSSVCKR